MTNPIIYYYSDGKIRSEQYFLNNKFHREDGPAIIYYYDNGKIVFEQYCLNDKRHREDGPAYISYYPDGKIERESYYLNGILYADNQDKNFQEDLKKYHRLVKLKSFL